MSKNTKKVVQPKQVQQQSNMQVYIGKFYGECACINDARGQQRKNALTELKLGKVPFSSVSVPTKQKQTAVIRKTSEPLMNYLVERFSNDTYYTEQLTKHMVNTLMKRQTVIDNDALLNDTDLFTKNSDGTFTVNPVTESNRQKCINIAHKQGIDYLKRNLKVQK